jgi:hypothetical protein
MPNAGTQKRAMMKKCDLNRCGNAATGSIEDDEG